MKAHVYSLAKVSVPKASHDGDIWLVAFMILFFGYVAWAMIQGPKK
jgi:hypothetical protein